MAPKQPPRAPQRTAAPPSRQQVATRQQPAQASRIAAPAQQPRQPTPQPRTGQVPMQQRPQAPAIVGAANLPAHLTRDAGRGLDKLKPGDYEMPRIRLLQTTSEEVKGGAQQSGQFWHHLAEMPLGTSMEIIPIYIDIRYILWRPLEDGGGILARADDGVHWNPPSGEWQVKQKGVPKPVTWTIDNPTVAGSQLDQWGTYNPDDNKSPPAATKMYNMVAVCPQLPDLTPAVITLQRSSIKVGMKLFGKMRLSPAPIYGQRFTMDAVLDNGPSGEFWNYAFMANGYVEDEEEFNGYKQLFDSFARAGLTIKDLESAQRDESQPQPGQAAEGAPQY